MRPSPLTPRARVLIALGLLFAACAQQGYPSGGPKDVTPPVITECTPANGSTHFAGKEFYLACDEYVQVKDANNNILVSPPMKHKPEYTPSGKGLRVRIKDTLQENTTYLFQFRGGIVDYNEGNALPGFEYVFSTGERVDSNMLCGHVADAFEGTPWKETVTVLAYPDSVSDSALVTARPAYMTRCDKEGFFRLSHLRPGSYKLLAMEDADRNLRLNPGEAVAFPDSAVTATPMPRSPKDSADSVAAPRVDTLQLRISDDKVDAQRIDKSDFLRKGRVQIVTKVPMSAGWQVTPLMEQWQQESTGWLEARANARRDTLDLWLAAECDSVVLHLRDTTGLDDTLRLQYRDKVTNPNARQRQKPEAATPLMKSRVAASHPYWDTLWIDFDVPVRRVAPDDSIVQILTLPDSSLHRCALRLPENSHPRADRSAYLDFEGQPGGKYRFTLPAGAVRDLYGRASDSLTFATEYTRPEGYGTIQLQLQELDSLQSYLLQLTDEKGTMLQQYLLGPASSPTTVTDTTLTIPHLKPGKYGVRLIIDSNADGQWTPGNYLLRRQPEPVLRLGKTLDLRANWTMEERWTLP